jgi:tripartite ATP-independent transporter DctP family solute receptor
VAGATLGSVSVVTRSLCAPAFAEGFGGPDVARTSEVGDYTFTQFHNQPATSPLHRRLVEMWAAIGRQTRGRVATQVFAENNAVAGSDPAALAMLVGGEIQFFTLMGGILGTVVPAAEVQQVPFAFRSAAHAHHAMDGALGNYLQEEMAAKGIRGFRTGAFDNGMRQIAGAKRPIVVPDDLIGIRMRVPAGQLVADTFRALGAEPITINSSGIYDAVKSGRVDAQENPLALLDLFKLYEVVKYVSLTNHMWSGFNLLAHLPTWTRLPRDIQAVIERNVTTYVRLQRQDQERANAGLRGELARRGLVFNDADPAPFRSKLSSVYATWKERLGTRCWSLLEAATRG